MKAPSNSESKLASPAKIRICVCSAGVCGASVMRPRPTRTTAVAPSGVIATNALPVAIVKVMSGALTVRLWTSNWRVASSDKR